MARTRTLFAGALAVATLCATATFPQIAEAYAPPTASSAASKPVYQTTNTWGQVPSGANVEVWTEVNLGTHWSKSQQRETNANGVYVIPLTYGAGTPGKYRYRVAARHKDGSVVRSEAFTLTRTAQPTASSAGSKPVGQPTNTWGHFPGGQGITVWTEVYRNGVWAKSQERRASSTGTFTIPLTYGATTVGSHQWRVAGRYPNGVVLRSNEFTLTRTSSTTAPCSQAVGIEPELTSQAVIVLRNVCNTFPDVDRYLGYRGSAGSYHAEGRAIDVMVSGSRGWDVAYHLQRNATQLGVTEIIYERRIWTTQRASEGWRWMSDRGSVSANHYDHVHISVG